MFIFLSWHTYIRNIFFSCVHYFFSSMLLVFDDLAYVTLDTLCGYCFLLYSHCLLYCRVKHILSYRYGYSQSSGTSVIPIFKKSAES